MPAIDGQKIFNLLARKNRIQVLLGANLVASLSCLVVVAGSGDYIDKQWVKTAATIGGLTFSASMFLSAKQYDDTEEAADYLLEHNNIDFKEEADTQLSLNESSREIRARVAQHKSLEEEYYSNPTYKMLVEEGKKAADKVDGNEEDDSGETPTTIDALMNQTNEDGDNGTKEEIKEDKTLVSEEQFGQIKRLTKEGFSALEAIKQVFGELTKEQFDAIVLELKKRIRP